MDKEMYSTQYTVHSTLYTVHSTLYTVHRLEKNSFPCRVLEQIIKKPKYFCLQQIQNIDFREN